MAFALQRLHGARVRSQQQAVFSSRRGPHKSRARPAGARAYAGDGEGPTAGLRELQASLAFAIRTEDYAAAAKLRDAIRELDQRDPARKATEIARVRQQLQEATTKEDYQASATVLSTE